MDLASLPPPSRTFSSDNSAGVHPRVLSALAEANEGHALAYGYDAVTRRADERFADLFGRQVDVYYVWSGTGANVMSLTTLLGPAQAVVCTEGSHINVDETGAPERIAGAKLIDLPTPDGKLRPDQLDALAHAIGVEHHAQPGVVSITQSTELGTLYSPDELGALSERAHALGMLVHLDGARIANATAALGGTAEALRSFTVDAGVDVISFGGTKNGMMYGEAVVYLDRSLARAAKYVRKQVTQLPSKMRYISAQFEALLDDGLWIDNARHANELAGQLYKAVAEIPGIELDGPPAVNSLYPRLPRPAIGALQAWSPFYDWDEANRQVRWMASWDTTSDDVERFAAGVRQALDG